MFREFRGAEEGEVDGAVDAHLAEAGMGGKIVRAGVLKDEEAAHAQQLAAQDGFGEFGEARQAVGGVGEDEWEGGGGAEVAEGVAADQGESTRGGG